MRHRLVSVRAYDADDMCIYALGDVCDGTMSTTMPHSGSRSRKIHTLSAAVFSRSLVAPEIEEEYR